MINFTEKKEEILNNRFNNSEAGQMVNLSETIDPDAALIGAIQRETGINQIHGIDYTLTKEHNIENAEKQETLNDYIRRIQDKYDF